MIGILPLIKYWTLWSCLLSKGGSKLFLKREESLEGFPCSVNWSLDLPPKRVNYLVLLAAKWVQNKERQLKKILSPNASRSSFSVPQFLFSYVFDHFFLLLGTQLLTTVSHTFLLSLFAHLIPSPGNYLSLISCWDTFLHGSHVSACFISSADYSLFWKYLFKDVYI